MTPAPAPAAAAAPRVPMRGDAEVVLVMGVPGAGKSRVAADYTTRGYIRLNRDERGGSLRELAEALDKALTSGTRRVVLDNTYLTRAARNDVIEAASRHGAPARCIWLDTPLAQAQVNLVERLLDRFGALPTPGELLSWRSWSRECWRRRRRCARSASSSRRRRTRASPWWSTCRSCGPVSARPGVFVAARALAEPGWEKRRRPRRTASGLRLESRRQLGRPRRGRCLPHRRGLRAGRRRALPARCRPADLLVPAAAAGAAARLRASARHRSVALDPRRKRARTPNARDALRRPLRPGYTVTTTLPGRDPHRGTGTHPATPPARSSCRRPA